MQGDGHVRLKRVGEDRRLKTADNDNPQCQEREKETARRGRVADFEYRICGRGEHAVATSWKVAGSIPDGVIGIFY